MHRLAFVLPATLCLAAAPAAAQVTMDSTALHHSRDELRHAVGTWDVTTHFLKPDGTLAREVQGTYAFAWVLPDRIVSGVATQPDMGTVSGILFYLRPGTKEVEMVSVGPDGRLWVMTGPLGGETRTSQPYPTTEGGTGRLRFTRFNVTPDRFESKMEWSEDEGATWVPGNHQIFVRRKG
jgi:hypothetical protein